MYCFACARLKNSYISSMYYISFYFPNLKAWAWKLCNTHNLTLFEVRITKKMWCEEKSSIQCHHLDQLWNDKTFGKANVRERMINTRQLWIAPLNNCKGFKKSDGLISRCKMNPTSISIMACNLDEVQSLNGAQWSLDLSMWAWYNTLWKDYERNMID